MILKTLLFLFLFYLLIKVVSNLFLPSSNKGASNVRFFYQTFKNVRNQQQNKQNQQGNSKSRSDQLNDIEDAEYEDITEEQSKSSS